MNNNNNNECIYYSCNKTNLYLFLFIGNYSNYVITYIHNIYFYKLINNIYLTDFNITYHSARLIKYSHRKKM